MVQPLLLQSLGFGLLRLLATSINHLDVVVENGRNHRYEVRLDYPSADSLRAADANIDHALEGEVPLPHIHHILAPPLLQDAYQSLDAAIDGKNITNPRGRGSQVGEVVEGVDQGKCGGAIEGPAVIEGSGNADGRLVDIRDAEINLSHDDELAARWRRGERSPSSGKCFRGAQNGSCRFSCTTSSTMPQRTHGFCDSWGGSGWCRVDCGLG